MKDSSRDHTEAGVEVRLMRDEEREQFRVMTAQSFALPPYRKELHSATLPDETWVLASDGRPLGGLRAELIGQFLGGKSIPTVAVSAVQILPEGRGQGWGSMLMKQVLAQVRDQGTVISVLYPTHVGFYRSLGYEFAGAYTRYRLPILAIPKGSNLPAVDEVKERDFPLIQQCYKRLGEASHGLLDRSERWWRTRVLNSTEDRPIYSYLVRGKEGVRGYIIYSQRSEPSAFEYSYSLVCHDLVWHDRETAEALLAFCGAHPVVGVSMAWVGPIEDPLAELIPVQQPEVQYSCRWMARLLDVQKAIESRGYQESIKAAVDLDVSDSIFSANSGPIRIEVSGGQARVTRAAKAKLALDVGTLSAIFTGWLPAREAVRTGRVKNYSKIEIQALETLFSSPKPWSSDHF